MPASRVRVGWGVGWRPVSRVRDGWGGVWRPVWGEGWTGWGVDASV